MRNRPEFATPATDGPLAIKRKRQESVVDLVIDESDRAPQIDGVVVGILAGFSDNGAPLVDFSPNGSGHPIAARGTVNLKPLDIGRPAALLFEEGDSRRPIVIGLIHNNERTASDDDEQSTSAILKVTADGERIKLTAEKEITLTCGESSITLTRAGKILIRGNYLLSRSSGVNRIKGGSVQIN
jgi:hypothetical protein